MAEVNDVNITEIQEQLLNWYFSNGRHFPWRRKKLNDYQLVIAEALLQRTKAETVSRFFIKFVEDFRDWEELNNAAVEDIEAYLKPIGLHRQRSKRLKSLAQEMVRRNGKLPESREDLESIPFLGQYIANAVELMIYNRPLPLLDVNMARVLERYFGPRRMADIRYDPYLQALAARFVNHFNAKELNWSILDFAALVCKALRPQCENCILKGKCSYYNQVARLPTPTRP